MSKQSCKQDCVMKKTSIGGQALIEGVMMRGPERTAMAVRHISGEIRTEEWDNPKKKPIFFAKWPVIRGLFGMASSLRIGYKCLMRSAELSGLEEELEDAMKEKKTSEATEETADVVENTEEVVEESAEEVAEETVEEATEETTEETAPEEKKEEKKKTSLLLTIVMIVGVVLGVGLSLVLFMWLPIQLFNWLVQAFPRLDNHYLRGVFEGVVRIAIFLSYILLVSRMKDIRRTFQYHGAEHKSIFCYEKGLPLTVENVRKQKRFHPRCGTSFLILMLVVGIFFSILIPPGLPTLVRTACKLAMLPLTVGIGYELIKLAGRHDNWFTRLISAPGLWMQRITTIEPEDDMIECAITALQAVIPEDPEADKW